MSTINHVRKLSLGLDDKEGSIDVSCNQWLAESDAYDSAALLYIISAIYSPTRRMTLRCRCKIEFWLGTTTVQSLTIM